MPTKLRDWLGLFVAIAIPLLAGGLGSLSTAQAIPTWYQRVRKPSWTPPAWVFGPVWTLLYTMMGIAAWLVWRSGRSQVQVRTAEGLFAGQLALNALWTPIFFGRRAFGLALADLVALWNVLLATLTQFYRVRPAAGLLLLPYLLWVSYAATLNAGMWWLNRTPSLLASSVANRSATRTTVSSPNSRKRRLEPPETVMGFPPQGLSKT